jgi:CheY-like chemotaxis protein
VHSGDDALALIRGGTRYDVILCDLMMPQVTGMAVHAEIEELDRAQADRMVFLTGGAFTVAAREFLDTIPNTHLEKPFDLAELRKVVNDTIG